VADQKAEESPAEGGERRRARKTAAKPIRDSGNSGRIVHFRSQDGLTLAARIFDAKGGARLPLLCLPGLSRNSRDFVLLGQFFSEQVKERRRVVALDYRGRGLSDPDPNWRNYTPLIEAQDVLTAAAAIGIERAVLVGTSRGGIIAMLLGALRPGLIAGVVLNDIGPVIEGTGLARIKKYLTTRRKIPDWPAAIKAARDTASGQFPALTDEDWRAAAEAYFIETPNGIAPQFDPGLMKAVAEADFAERVPVLWPQFMSLARVPVLAIRGEFSDLLSAKSLAAMAARHPQFEQLTVQGQGHAPLLRDRISLERIEGFARRCEIPGAAVAADA
jgi:pimeloyl-ACP methyl ester carboxylesterase